jgi:mono/diheme cytochrome c family protein
LRSIARRLSFVVLLLLASLLAACSLASPAPVGKVSSQAQQPPAAQSAEPFQLPSRRPDAVAGAALYQEKCVRCHGEAGRGDGEMAGQIQTQFGSPVSDLTSDVTARAKTPQQWYDAVSNGNLQKGMPPFSGSLNPDQRWDVIAYAWSLAATPDQIATGKAVYQEQCAHCHGDQGKGDGKDAPANLSDLSDFAALAQAAPGLWDQALATGHVPSFAGTLSEGARRASIDYVRTFAYDSAASASASSATPNATPGGLPSTTTGPAAPIKIEGTIINATAGQSVPDNLPLTLYIVPHQGSQQDMITRTFQSGVGGRFVITDAQIDSSNLVAVGVDYKDLSFYSDVAPAGPQVTLPITVYESTSDAAQVKVDTLHIVVEPDANGLNVTEIYVLSNDSDRFVAGFGQPVLHFGLPAGATNLQLDPAQQRVIEQAGDGLDYYDAIPVGQQVQQIVYQYSLPSTATSLGRAIYQPLAAVNLLLSGQADQLTVTSDQLKAGGPQTIPSSGQTFQQYTAFDMQPGQTLSVSISTPASPFDWRIVLGVGLVIVGVIGLVIWQRGQKRQPVAADNTAAQREALIDQIAALDDEFADGQIDEINYKAKRAQLKEKLLKLMEEA